MLEPISKGIDLNLKQVGTDLIWNEMKLGGCLYIRFLPYHYSIRTKSDVNDFWSFERGQVQETWASKR